MQARFRRRRSTLAACSPLAQCHPSCLLPACPSRLLQHLPTALCCPARFVALRAVNDQNCETLANLEDVDGFLVRSHILMGVFDVLLVTRNALAQTWRMWTASW